MSFFAVLLFSGSLSEKIFGSELLFLGGLVGLVFFGGVLPMFLLHFLAVRFRKCLKNSLDVRSGVFWGSFSLPFVFFRRRRRFSCLSFLFLFQET